MTLGHVILSISGIKNRPCLRVDGIYRRSVQKHAQSAGGRVSELSFPIVSGVHSVKSSAAEDINDLCLPCVPVPCFWK